MENHLRQWLFQAGAPSSPRSPLETLEPLRVVTHDYAHSKPEFKSVPLPPPAAFSRTSRSLTPKCARYTIPARVPMPEAA